MRGKDTAGTLLTDANGITPARAGKRNRRRRHPGQYKDHPRACGEKLGSRPPRGGRGGSPPRVRGKEACQKQTEAGQGITPARAGKSIWGTLWLHCTRDHPRACGEKFRFPGNLGRPTGSPPRVRGKVVASMAVGSFVRITPARAGKSPFRAYSLIINKDHPRACGEKFGRLSASDRAKGSPPRVRGKAV